MRRMPPGSVKVSRPEPWICTSSRSIGSASQAISRPFSAAWAAGWVSISPRVNQGLRRPWSAGKPYTGTVWRSVRTRLASSSGSK